MSYALGDTAPAPREGFVWVPAAGGKPGYWTRVVSEKGVSIKGRIATPEDKARIAARLEAEAAGAAPGGSKLFLYGGIAAGLVVLYVVLKKKKETPT